MKVDSFLNHQMDIALMEEIGREFKRRFADKPISKVLTIDAGDGKLRCCGIRNPDGSVTVGIINRNKTEKEITLEFYRFLREETKFPDLAALQRQIHTDAEETRHYFLTH